MVEVCSVQTPLASVYHASKHIAGNGLADLLVPLMGYMDLLYNTSRFILHGRIGEWLVFIFCTASHICKRN